MLPVRLVIMGPAGTGKTTLASALAAHWGIEFVDGDGLHLASNIAKMRRGEALTDDDRLPWLEAIADILRSHVERRRSVVIACSALKRAYRDLLRKADPGLRLVFLNAPRAVLEARVADRTGHFLPAELVADQCAQLERPGPDENVLTLDATAPVAALVANVQSWLLTG
jgi:gluconokinase